MYTFFVGQRIYFTIELPSAKQNSFMLNTLFSFEPYQIKTRSNIPETKQENSQFIKQVYTSACTKSNYQDITIHKKYALYNHR